jgi:hypothetical protein
MRNLIINFAIAVMVASLLVGVIAMAGIRPNAKTYYAPVIGGHQSLQPVW